MEYVNTLNKFNLEDKVFSDIIPDDAVTVDKYITWFIGDVSVAYVSDLVDVVVDTPYDILVFVYDGINKAYFKDGTFYTHKKDEWVEGVSLIDLDINGTDVNIVQSYVTMPHIHNDIKNTVIADGKLNEKDMIIYDLNIYNDVLMKRALMSLGNTIKFTVTNNENIFRYCGYEQDPNGNYFKSNTLLTYVGLADGKISGATLATSEYEARSYLNNVNVIYNELIKVDEVDVVQIRSR